MGVISAYPPPNGSKGRILVMTLEQLNVLIHPRQSKYMPPNHHFSNLLQIRFAVANASVRVNVNKVSERWANGEGADHNNKGVFGGG